METEPTIQEQKPKKHWFRRHPILSGLLGLFLLLWFVGFITEVTSKNTSPINTQAAAKYTPTPKPTVTSPVEPSNTTTPTKQMPMKKPTQTPSYTPTPTRKQVYPTVLPTSDTVTSLPTTPFVPSQQANQTNNGATALCNDGTYSYAAHDQGACSHHQGVKEFYK